MDDTDIDDTELKILKYSTDTVVQITRHHSYTAMSYKTKDVQYNHCRDLFHAIKFYHVVFIVLYCF